MTASPAMQNAAVRIQITVEPDAAYAALAALEMRLKNYEEALQKCTSADGRAYWLDTIARTRLHVNQLDRGLRTSRAVP